MAKVGKAAQAKRAPKAPPKRTDARKSIVVPAPSKQISENISIRRISNGWVIRESREVNGKYTENETFTRTKPSINIPK
jgi:hypothetical protein